MSKLNIEAQIMAAILTREIVIEVIEKHPEIMTRVLLRLIGFEKNAKVQEETNPSDELSDL